MTLQKERGQELRAKVTTSNVGDKRRGQTIPIDDSARPVSATANAGIGSGRKQYREKVVTPFDRLSWGNDDGTRCEAVQDDLTIYIVSCEKGDYWLIVRGTQEDLVEEGYGEDGLKTAFNRIQAGRQASTPQSPCSGKP